MDIKISISHLAKKTVNLENIFLRQKVFVIIMCNIKREGIDANNR